MTGIGTEVESLRLIEHDGEEETVLRSHRMG